MSDALIFDAIRTPRGKGKPGAGALYETKPIDLVVTLLDALRQRNDLDPAHVDDLIMGVSSAVGDQGSCLPRIAALCGAEGWAHVPGMALQRFCGAGLEAVNIAAEKVKSGWHSLTRGGERQADEVILKGLIERHFKHTGSTIARTLLDDWSNARTKFVKVFPTEYKRALGEMHAAAAKAKEKVTA